MGHKMLVIILVRKFCCVSELYKCSSPCFELWFVGLSHFLRCAIKNPYVPLVDTCIGDLFRRKASISASNCYLCLQVAIPKIPQHLHLVVSTPREIRFRFLFYNFNWFVIMVLGEVYLIVLLVENLFRKRQIELCDSFCFTWYQSSPHGVVKIVLVHKEWQ